MSEYEPDTEPCPYCDRKSCSNGRKCGGPVRPSDALPKERHRLHVCTGPGCTRCGVLSWRSL